MITEARVEIYENYNWEHPSGFDHTTVPIPQAVEDGRALRAHELRSECFSYKPAPIRVVDSSGAVVAQWGKPQLELAAPPSEPTPPVPGATWNPLALEWEAP